MTEKAKQENNFKMFYSLSIAMQLGFMMFISIGTFIFLGVWLDSFFHTKPILILTSIFLGMIFTGFEIYYLLKPIFNNQNK